jgi:hypothetical protein
MLYRRLKPDFAAGISIVLRAPRGSLTKFQRCLSKAMTRRGYGLPAAQLLTIPRVTCQAVGACMAADSDFLFAYHPTLVFLVGAVCLFGT